MEDFMRINNCLLNNFASYKRLEFIFDRQGLALIQGPTGSGKSTLCDAIPWILFGRTAKDGTVDEVRSWNADGDTTGTITLTVNDKVFQVGRTRGKANDLIIWEDGGAYRGKDLNDTQKIINQKLGIDINTYLAGAYYHEFSQTAQFFTTTAKNRRAICEQLVDLSLAKTLQIKGSERRKALLERQSRWEQKIKMYEDRLKRADTTAYKQKAEEFEQTRSASITRTNVAIANLIPKIQRDAYFKQEYELLIQAKEKLGSEVCSECGSNKNSQAIADISKMIYKVQDEERNNTGMKQQIKDLKTRLIELESTENPYATVVQLNDKEHRRASIQKNRLTLGLAANTKAIADCDILLELVGTMRSISIQNAIQSLEDRTNQLLSDHFDAEIKVLFAVEDADKLDVTIFKDGNACAYTQLSKGQRQLLKLSFGMSVMRSVADHSGTSFNCAFIDEALEGLDENKKIQAFGLLQELSTEFESVFVVDHSEALKAMFTNAYSVRLENGESIIEKV